MPVRRTPGMDILLHFYWPVADGALTPEACTKLGSYITRYAETMNIRVHAVGGLGNHLHVLADLPGDIAAERVSRELHGPTARYLRDVMSIRSFSWDAANVRVVSVSPWDRDHVVEYIGDQEQRHANDDAEPALEGTAETAPEKPGESGEELPSWLTDALRK